MDFYLDLPYTSKTPKEDFYTFHTVNDIIMKGSEKRERVFKCRTIAILENVGGKYLLSDISTDPSEKQYLLVSVCFLKTKIPSTIMPYCVQVFGTVEWKSQPILYARILEVLPTKIATIVHSTMIQTVTNHRVEPVDDTNYQNNDETVIYDVDT